MPRLFTAWPPRRIATRRASIQRLGRRKGRADTTPMPRSPPRERFARENERSAILLLAARHFITTRGLRSARLRASRRCAISRR